ncbi:DNA polymerase Y family protein [Phyllobacterium sp. 628]|uniref:Y-family DNA polymerase n=1 Tax=Phyllobacterium sp. 628 TaxID=2718938 RepID=UPI0016623A71|nr:DNA polymerase Y family protein [Phyllobacterium sp. 628]QND54041.1 DNA polymerase Y family protein [Phyllobacterium sp. 628]
MVDKVANALRLTATDERAAKTGLHKGMALTDARAQFEQLDIAFASPRKDAALLEKLADWCDRYTPLVAFDGNDGLMLDITGCVHLFGDEQSLRKDIHQRLSQHGMIVRSAIADNPPAARAFARHSPGGVIGQTERDAKLRSLRLVSLAIEEVHLAGLKRAGLRSVGDIEVLPRAALAARFGAGLVDSLDALFGSNSEPISPRRIIPVCMAERRMAEPLIVMESVELVLHALGDELFRQLQKRVEGAREIEASFFRVDGHVRRLNIQAGQPLTDTKTLFRLLKERLSNLADPLDAGYGFDLVRLAAVRTERTQVLQKSLDNNVQETGEIGSLIDRLSIRLGSGRVLRPKPVDTHIPERAVSLEPAAQVSPSSPLEWTPNHHPGEPPIRPIRLFQPPEHIETTAGIPDGAPAQFIWRSIRHYIVLAEGPERIAPEWWREHAGALTRDYYRLEDNQGHRFWVFREGLYERGTVTPRWYLHGLFA